MRAAGRGRRDAAEAILLTTFGTAAGSNPINNLPMALVMTSAVQTVAVHSPLGRDSAYATVIGCDLGPNLTHLGSLATFLWLFFLRRQGIDVSVRSYLKLGLVTTPPMLLSAGLALWLTGHPQAALSGRRGTHRAHRRVEMHACARTGTYFELVPQGVPIQYLFAV